MAEVIVTLKLMPESPDVDLSTIYDAASNAIKAFVDEAHADREIKKEENPIGFGLKALMLTVVMDESVGDTEELEKTLSGLDGVESVSVTNVTRALG